LTTVEAVECAVLQKPKNQEVNATTGRLAAAGRQVEKWKQDRQISSRSAALLDCWQTILTL
jgi:hypothetical protein